MGLRSQLVLVEDCGFSDRMKTLLRDIKGKWFNPLTGEYSAEIEPVMEQWLRFEPP